MLQISTACPLCHSRSSELLYDFSVTDVPGGIPGKIMRCPRCSMLFKEYTGKSLEEAYGDAYVATSEIMDFFSGNAARTFFRDILSGIIRHRGSSCSGQRLLDIGCGPGTLLEEAAPLGFQCYGVELSSQLAAIATAKGFCVHNGFAEEFRPPWQADVITMMDVIEHVPDPLLLLRGAKSLLAPGGTLVVFTPNHASFIVRLAAFFHLLGLPRPLATIFANNHISFFTQATLSDALRRVGLKPVSLKQSPYDAARPGHGGGGLAVGTAGLLERLAHSMTGTGFRMLAYVHHDQ